MIENITSITINSQWLTSGVSNSFYYNVSIDPKILQQLNYCSVTQVSIPKSIYSVKNGQNVLNLYENGFVIPITIPQGWYSKTQLFSMLWSLLTAGWVNWIVYVASDNQTLYWDGKMLITATNPSAYLLKITFPDTELYYILGFYNQTYTFKNWYTTLVSDTILNLNINNNVVMLLFMIEYLRCAGMKMRVVLCII